MKLKNKSILVTGGAGFIGSHLVDRLIREEPSNLVVVDNFFLGREENLSHARKTFPTLTIYRMDASNLASMRHLIEMEKIQVVFDLASIPLPTSLHFPAWTVETNISIATTFCELARWGMIESLVHCSSSEAYGTADYVPMDESHPLKPMTPYAASKAGADQVVYSYWKTFGIDAVLVRPFNTFGPRQNPGSYAGIIPIVIQRVRKGEPIEIHGDGEQTRDFIFVREVSEAFVHLYEEASTRGKVVNIATGKEISVNTLVRDLLRVMGKPDHPVVYTDARLGDVRRHCGDIKLAKEIFKFDASGLSDRNLKETVEWYLSSVEG